MTFEDVLTAIANAYGFDAYDLIGYSYEDEISGWDNGYGDWPVGSLWTVEGRILYALVRMTQPETVIEIGTNVGCGASHIASALKMNGKGKLLTFDINESITIPPDKSGVSPVYRQGELIPDELLPFVEIIQADGIEHLRASKGEVDFIYEDGAHSFDSTNRAWTWGVEKLKPSGFMLSHDAAHFLVGEDIQKGIAAAGVVPNIYEVQPSDCGLAIYRKPETKVDPYAEVSKDIPLSAFIPNGDGELVDFDYPHEKPKRIVFEDLTVTELREYADDHDIDLGNARKKATIIKKLRGA